MGAKALIESDKVLKKAVAMEDKLREAAALGDLDGLAILVRGGANVNNQHKMNKWTALHWTAKRNAGQAVKYLLSAGADDKLLDASGRMAGDLSTDPQIREILAITEQGDAGVPVKFEGKINQLSFTPSYLKHPVFHKEEYFKDAVHQTSAAAAVTTAEPRRQ